MLSPWYVYYKILILSFLQRSDGDMENHQTAKDHHELLLARRNRACSVYDAARQAFSDFDKKALLWADVSNKISKSPAEKELISEVKSHFIIFMELILFCYRLKSLCPSNPWILTPPPLPTKFLLPK